MHLNYTTALASDLPDFDDWTLVDMATYETTVETVLALADEVNE